MGRVFDFAKRRIAGYIVFWILVLLFLGIFYGNDPPAQAGALFILVIAFIGSLLFTRRLKRKQRARRETRDAALRMHQAQPSNHLNGRHLLRGSRSNRCPVASDPLPRTENATCLPLASGGAPSLS